MEGPLNYQAGLEPDADSELDPWPTTDELVAMARAHRQGDAYPTPARLLENLPVVMRGLCDYVLLSGEADAYHMAYAIASLIEVIEHVREPPPNELPPGCAH